MTGAELRRVFGWPALLALASAIGLVSALVGDGVWDVVSWLALGLVVLVAGACWWRRDRASPRRR
ncbi:MULTISPECIES: hypothetical protein [Luteimonas]|uniref:hypothetical protein n=1 Tax=Luteimonas TaxID=83614 RepID=UPI000C7A18DD|nr:MULTISPECIES: hypothetical protein [Luteimonas]